MKSLIILFFFVFLPFTVYGQNNKSYSQRNLPYLMHHRLTKCSPHCRKVARHLLKMFLTKDDPYFSHDNYFKRMRERYKMNHLSINHISAMNEKEHAYAHKEMHKLIGKDFGTLNKKSYYKHFYFQSGRFYFVVYLYNDHPKVIHKKDGVVEGRSPKPGASRIMIFDKKSLKMIGTVTFGVFRPANQVISKKHR